MNDTVSGDDLITGDDFDQNYDRFIEDALATGCVWGLETGDGWAVCPSNSNGEIDVIPLWSQPEYAQRHCVEEWAQYQVVPISVGELMDDWLPGLHEDLILIGPNWNEEMEGLEVEPLDLLEDMEEVLE